MCAHALGLSMGMDMCELYLSRAEADMFALPSRPVTASPASAPQRAMETKFRRENLADGGELPPSVHDVLVSLDSLPGPALAKQHRRENMVEVRPPPPPPARISDSRPLRSNPLCQTSKQKPSAQCTHPSPQPFTAAVHGAGGRQRSGRSSGGGTLAASPPLVRSVANRRLQPAPCLLLITRAEHWL